MVAQACSVLRTCCQLVRTLTKRARATLRACRPNGKHIRSSVLAQHCAHVSETVRTLAQERPPSAAHMPAKLSEHSLKRPLSAAYARTPTTQLIDFDDTASIVQSSFQAM